MSAASESEPGRADGVVRAVCRVFELLPDDGDVAVTAIDKRPVAGAVPVGAMGVEGDQQMDRRHHGGVDKAVYVYGDEDAAWWAAELGREIPAGLFGENLRVSGVDVTGAVIGERWRIGSVECVVSQPRIPCPTFARRMAEADWIARFTAGGRPGAYLRVDVPGVVAAGDRVRVLAVPDHGVTIGGWFTAVCADGGAGADAARMAQALVAARDAGVVTLSESMVRRIEQVLESSARTRG